MLSIVQSTTYVPPGATDTLTLTLGTAPTIGNLFLLCFSFSQATNARTLVLPDAYWTTQSNYINTSNSTDSLAVLTRTIRAGDTTTVTFTLSDSGTADWLSGVLFEITGANTAAPVNQLTAASVPGSSWWVPNPATPSVLGTLPFLIASSDYGPNPLVSVSPTGWTNGPTAVGASGSTHSTDTATHTLTTDTITALAPTMTLTYQYAGVATLVLVAPALVPIQRLMLLGCGQ